MPRLKSFLWDRWTDWALAEVERDAPEVLAVDTETSGLAFFDLPFCATLTYRGPEGLASAYIDLEDEGWERRRDVLRQILDGVPTWVAHNWKFDAQKLDLIGALPQREHNAVDTQPLAALLDENRRLALKSLAVTELGIEDVIEVEIKSGPNKGQTKSVPREAHHLAKVRRKLKLTADDGYHLLPRDVLVPYALRDTELTLLLYEKLTPQLPPELAPVYDEELEVARILRAMEANGVGIDVPYLEEANEEYGAKVMLTWQALVKQVGRDDFNPNSPKQLLEAFQSAGVTLESTDKAHLRDMVANKATPAKAVALAEALREYRDAEKVFGTYLAPLLREQRDGIAHPWLNAVGPRTGRMSSSTATND